MAGELGVEPKLTESETGVLPLDDSPKYNFEMYSDRNKKTRDK
jgi:hypothetical protein